MTLQHRKPDMANEKVDEHKEYDIIVVGAGIIGPVLAAGFAKQGRSVLIIERDMREPDRIVGELLQPGGVRALERLGFEDCLEGIDAVKVNGYQVIYQGKGVNIPYPALDAKMPSGPREQGRAFHHGRFIMNLRNKAAEEPNVTFLEGTVTQVIRNPYTNHVLGVKVADKALGGDRHFHAKLTVMCDGIQSKFRKEFSNKLSTVKSHFAGLVLQDPVLPAPNHGHVIIGDHQPILIYQIGSHETRILCDIAGHLPSNGNGDLKRHLEAKVMPNLPEEVKPSFEKALEGSRIRTMPAQFLPASRTHDYGVVLVGDALNIRHPLTGGGMTVAFNDATVLLDVLSPAKCKDLGNRQAVKRQLDKFYFDRKNVDSVVNILAMALYQLFAAKGENLKILQRGCFRYFQLGGNCINEPVSLLAGLLPRPFVLFSHFFSVAFYAVLMNFYDKGVIGFPLALIQVFTVLYTACVVFIPFLWSEVKWY